jgi:hypothetical protein
LRRFGVIASRPPPNYLKIILKSIDNIMAGWPISDLWRQKSKVTMTNQREISKIRKETAAKRDPRQVVRNRKRQRLFQKKSEGKRMLYDKH